MGRLRVLFIEDDLAMVRALATFFRCHPRYDVEFAANGVEALRMLEDGERYSLVVIEWDLPEPGPNGLEICRTLRSRPTTTRTGIVFVTRRDAIKDKLSAFDAGADDYVVKPFDVRELKARLDSVSLRALPPAAATVDDNGARIAWGRMMIDLTTQLVQIGSRQIVLPKQQFLVLVFLVRRAGLPASEREIRENVLRTTSSNRSSTVRNLVRELRERLGGGGELVQSVRGVGYRIVPPENVGEG